MRRASRAERGGERQAAIRAAARSVPRSALRASRSSAAYSLVEMVAALAIFGVFLVVLASLQRELLKYDGEVRVALFTHPAPLSVLARLRRDVLDSRGYPESAGIWTQSPETLLLEAAGDDGTPRVIVWDFRENALARRIELRSGQRVASWEARAVPAYRIGSWEAPDGRVAVVVTAKDKDGNVVVDQIVTPRAR